MLIQLVWSTSGGRHRILRQSSRVGRQNALSNSTSVSGDGSEHMDGPREGESIEQNTRPSMESTTINIIDKPKKNRLRKGKSARDKRKTQVRFDMLSISFQRGDSKINDAALWLDGME